MTESASQLKQPAGNPEKAGETPSGLSGFSRQGNSGGDERAVVTVPPARTGFDPHELFRTISKWRLLIIVALIAGPAIALGISMLVTPLYSAASQIEISQEAPKIIPGAENSQPIVVNDNQFLATQLGLLRSESLARKVVDAERLAGNPLYVNQELDARSRREAAVSALRGQVEISVVRDSRLVDIKVTGPDAAMAAKVANAYGKAFIASNIQRDFDATAYARDLLQKRLETTRTRLEESERALVAYAARQGIVELGTNGEGRANQSLDAASLIALNNSLADARAERITAEQRYRQSNGPVTESITNPTIQTLTTQRAALQAEYQDRLSVFTPEMPSMAAMRDRISALNKEIERVDTSVRGSMLANYRAALARENELGKKVSESRLAVLDLRDRSIQYTILQRDVDTNRALYDALLQRFREVGVSDGVGNNKISIVDEAKVRNTPVSPNIPINLLIGLLLGAIAGIGGAFLIEFIDDTIKLPEDVPNKLGVTLLGILPAGKSETDFATQVADPKSDLSEASYSLRTALQFATDHGIPRSLLVTSCRPAEGKSSVALTLATAFGRLGKRTLLIDADMRKPTFYVEGKARKDTTGLSNLLVKQNAIEDAVHATEIRNVSLIPAGAKVPSPAELLSNASFRELLDTLESRYDVIVVDGPPVLGLADAPLLASACEASLIVIETAAIRRSLATSAIARLHAANARLIGAVLNKFHARHVGYGYGYAYSYDYGEDRDRSEMKQIKVGS